MEKIEIQTPHMCATLMEDDGRTLCEFLYEPCLCFSAEKHKTMKSRISYLCQKAPNRAITNLEILVNKKRTDMNIRSLQLELQMELVK